MRHIYLCDRFAEAVDIATAPIINCDHEMVRSDGARNLRYVSVNL